MTLNQSNPPSATVALPALHPSRVSWLTLSDMMGALSPEVRLTDWISAPFDALSAEEATTID